MLGAARWRELAEAPAFDGKSARRASRRLGRKRMQDVFDRYEGEFREKQARALAKEADKAERREARAAERARRARNADAAPEATLCGAG